MRHLALIALLLFATALPAPAVADTPPCVPLALLAPAAVEAKAPCTELLASLPPGDVRTLRPNTGITPIALTLRDAAGAVLLRLDLTPPRRYPLSITNQWPRAAATLEIEADGEVTIWAWPQEPQEPPPPPPRYEALLPLVAR